MKKGENEEARGKQMSAKRAKKNISWERELKRVF